MAKMPMMVTAPWLCTVFIVLSGILLGLVNVHPAWSRQCPKFLVEKQIQELKVKENISLFEACMRFKASHPLVFRSSFAQVVGQPLARPAAPAKSTVSVQTCDCLLGITPCSSYNPVVPIVDASSQVVSALSPPDPPPPPLLPTTSLPVPPTSSPVLLPTPSLPVFPTPHPPFCCFTGFVSSFQ